MQVSPTVTDSVTLTSGFAPYTAAAYSLFLFAAYPNGHGLGPGSFLAAGSSTANSAGGTVVYNFTPRASLPSLPRFVCCCWAASACSVSSCDVRRQR